MIPLPACVRVWLATGYTDMRKGFPSLTLQVQEILHRDPLSGHLFCFRGCRGNLLKVIWHDGQVSSRSHSEVRPLSTLTNRGSGPRPLSAERGRWALRREPQVSRVVGLLQLSDRRQPATIGTDPRGAGCFIWKRPPSY
ncbi:IS66 family insertion sequence element accessory protein TnpB [Bradyrhizobium sp. Arg237L]|uniref:IS66 family insertion sequence element accessory protein TnpB n=1 Tax=Bradyrhizobium sp. Arg237L TaxID=3003352 RepID=UPI00249DED20|nr:IS66 family insertion sequence element accessory protein TnpB [Bradyrhizobium sp. Arg237L]MDI4232580.1 IS66 family insertion sequence element accessory protein TnpB [Bradyrhizobium sp. Arg237L]